MYVCMYVRMCVLVCVLACECVYVCVCWYVCSMHVCVCAGAPVRLCVSVRAHASVFV